MSGGHLVGVMLECDCGAEAPVMRDDWNYWVQLAPHRQPKTGLVCSLGRLLACIPIGRAS